MAFIAFIGVLCFFFAKWFYLENVATSTMDNDDVTAAFEAFISAEYIEFGSSLSFDDIVSDFQKFLRLRKDQVALLTVQAVNNYFESCRRQIGNRTIYRLSRKQTILTRNKLCFFIRGIRIKLMPEEVLRFLVKIMERAPIAAAAGMIPYLFHWATREIANANNANAAAVNVQGFGEKG